MRSLMMTLTGRTRAMTADLPRFTAARTVVDAAAAQPLLDYYVVCSAARGGRSILAVDGILVEEFVLADDYTTIALNSAGWTSAELCWSSAASISRELRRDPALRAHVVTALRRDVEVVYRRLGGGELPDEPTLRTYFGDPLPLGVSAPLRLSSADVPHGFHDKRIYRTLFANDLPADSLPILRAAWQMTAAADLADPRAGVIGTAGRRVADDVFTWDLRRIGTRLAWCLDLTACLCTGRDDAIGPLLWELTTQLRQHGLIPVTTERFN
jgi:hypothetical protein